MCARARARARSCVLHHQRVAKNIPDRLFLAPDAPLSTFIAIAKRDEPDCT
jgi:hypothetical protein